MLAFDPKTSFANAPVGQLATVTPEGSPHLVPVVFAYAKEVVYTAIDAKKKTTHSLRRLTNIQANPQVSMLVHHYVDDWSQLWWVRVDGLAAVHERGEEMATAYALLRAKYPQYHRVSLAGPVVTIAVTRWAHWHA